MWTDSIAAINKYLADDIKTQWRAELWYGHADMNTGARTATTFGALDAFFPAVLALGGDLARGEAFAGLVIRDVETPRHRTRGV